MFRKPEQNNRSTVMLLAGVGVVAMGYAAFVLLRNENVRRRLGLSDAVVDGTSEESFPASDAPSWTPTTSLGSLH